MTAYYNENDPGVACWLRELVAQGWVAPGDVDDRSIADVQPDDLNGYDQCHFFAGIGGWSVALRLAGWPDNRPVWTGSPPCQPFSSIGRHGGLDDERHLWPEFVRLVRQRRPTVVVGEQVASAAGRAWWAGVQTDLEALGYAAAAADLCAAGVGAPHIRQRLYWSACGLGDTSEPGLEGYAGHGDRGEEPRRNGADARGPAGTAGRDCWDTPRVPCADGKARRVEPGIEPLVDGIPSGVVRGGHQRVLNTPEARKLRIHGYGNAIVPPLAAEFIRAVDNSRWLL